MYSNLIKRILHANIRRGPFFEFSVRLFVTAATASNKKMHVSVNLLYYTKVAIFCLCCCTLQV